MLLSCSDAALAFLPATNPEFFLVDVSNLLNKSDSMCRAIVSLAVTVPSVYYLMQPQIERIQHPEKHGHGGHGEHEEHNEHDEEGDSNEDGGSGEEKGEDSSESGEEASKEGEGDEASSDDPSSQDAEQDTSDEEGSENAVHEKEGGQDVEGVQFKGATSGGTKEGEQGDTRKHIPDAKGFNKKRIESHYGGKEGEAQNPEQDPSDKDLVSIAHPYDVVENNDLLTLNIRPLHPNRWGT